MPLTSSTAPVRIWLGVDTGGTFTDFVCATAHECRIHKVLSTPHAPEQAIIQGIEELGLGGAVAAGELAVVHGSTVATNAALEKKGVSTVYITNTGFADILTLGRQNRPQIYQLCPVEEPPPVAADHCLEVDVRRDYQGQSMRALNEASLQALKCAIESLQPRSVAINLLYSYINDEDERRIEALLQDDYFVCRSSEVLPEYKEYERGMATWLNAWLGPLVAGYLSNLRSALAGAPLAIMQSSGGTISAEQAARRAVNMLLSGPAGGLSAAQYIGQQSGHRRLLTFDMGGTSTDVALIDGGIRLTTESVLGGYPVAVPTVDMHTIGAGGGSIAYLDSGGLLHVGPQSAGADPGPACYGRGGQQATVTDANTVLGRLRPEYFLGGQMALDATAAESALGCLAQAMGLGVQEAAEGVIALANEHMVKALRVISVQKGYDPREFTLCCFGGAGGLHVCALAEALGISRIIIPNKGGVLSAFGMLVAPRQRNLSQSLLRDLSQQGLALVAPCVKKLTQRAQSELRAEGVDGDLLTEVSLDCRYKGQTFFLPVSWRPEASAGELEQAFHRVHQSRFGHALESSVEIVNVRVQVATPAHDVTAWSQAPKDADEKGAAQQATVTLPGVGEAAVVWRDDLIEGQQMQGPMIVCERVATTWVGPTWEGVVDAFGHLQLRRSNGERS